MPRSTQTQIKKLRKEFTVIFGEDKNGEKLEVLRERLANAMQAVNSDIGNIILGPYVRGEWTIYFLYRTSEKFISVNLQEVADDESKWLDSICAIAKQWVDYADSQLDKKAKPTETTLDDWLAQDIERAKNRVKRLSKHDGSDKAKQKLNKAQATVRTVRREVWDVEETIKAKPDDLAQQLAKYKDNFPTTCKNALEGA